MLLRHDCRDAGLKATRNQRSESALGSLGFALHGPMELVPKAQIAVDFIGCQW